MNMCMSTSPFGRNNWGFAIRPLTGLRKCVVTAETNVPPPGRNKVSTAFLANHLFADVFNWDRNETDLSLLETTCVSVTLLRAPIRHHVPE